MGRRRFAIRLFLIPSWSVPPGGSGFAVMDGGREQKGMKVRKGDCPGLDVDNTHISRCYDVEGQRQPAAGWRRRWRRRGQVRQAQGRMKAEVKSVARTPTMQQVPMLMSPVFPDMAREPNPSPVLSPQ